MLNQLNINYFLSRLLLSPILPVVLGVILFIMFKYFEPSSFLYCDDLTLEQLKDTLANETIKYNRAVESLSKTRNLMKVAIDKKLYSAANMCEIVTEVKLDKVCQIFHKIRDLEENFKKLESNFESSIEEPRFL